MKIGMCGFQDRCVQYTFECADSPRSGTPHGTAAPQKVLKIYREGRILPTKSGNLAHLETEDPYTQILWAWLCSHIGVTEHITLRGGLQHTL
jgi:hypothetical protein